MKPKDYSSSSGFAGTTVGAVSSPRRPVAAERAAAALAIGLAAALAPPANAIELREFIALSRPAPTHQIRYGAAVNQAIDVFLPAGAGPHPVAILIHGGCWADLPGANREQLRPLAAEWARRGVAVWSIGYRRANEKGGGYPHMYRDVGQAIDRLQVEHQRLGIDLTRRVLAGHSAGGHLALWAAARPNLSPTSPLNLPTAPLTVTQVVSIAGIGDLAAFAPRVPGICGPGVLEGLTGPGVDPFADVSPARLGLPAGVHSVVMLSATADKLVPLHTAHDYRHALSQAEAARVHLRDVPDAGHFDLVAPGTAAFEAVFEEVRRAVGVPPPAVAPRVVASNEPD